MKINLYLIVGLSVIFNFYNIACSGVLIYPSIQAIKKYQQFVKSQEYDQDLIAEKQADLYNLYNQERKKQIGYTTKQIITSVVPDLKNIINYFKTTVTEDTNNFGDWLYQMFSTSCTKEQLEAYKQLKQDRGEFLNDKNGKTIDPVNLLNQVCKKNILTLMLLDICYGFFDLPEIREQSLEDKVGQSYLSIFLESAPKMIINKNFFTMINFVGNTYFDLFMNRQTKEAIAMKRIIDRASYTFLNNKEYQLPSLIKYFVNKEEAKQASNVIQYILGISLMVRYPMILAYELGLIKNMNAVQKRIEARNTPISLSIPFESLQFRVRKINLLLPEEHKIMELLVPMLVGAIYNPYGFGQYLKRQLLLTRKNIVALNKK